MRPIKTDYSLSKNDTFRIKGIAICLMLWHHLFYLHPEYGQFVVQTAQLGKVCVSLFLFVSAYGLTKQYQKIANQPVNETFLFLAKRFVKFYTNYWMIFLIFVPLGVFVFGRELSVPYGGGRGLKMLFTDFWGINGFHSYNITWWFNQLIIYLYLLFPMLSFFMKKKIVWILLFGIVIWKINFPILLPEAHNWLFHFLVGIAVALNMNKISVFFNRFSKWIILAVMLLLLLLLTIQRVYGIIPFLIGIRVDAFLAPTIVAIAVILFRRMKYFSLLLSFLGKHSINIFMIHTFVYYYWFEKFIYSFEKPIFIFFVLITVSLLISIGLEYIKKTIRLSQFIEKININIDKLVL